MNFSDFDGISSLLDSLLDLLFCFDWLLRGLIYELNVGSFVELTGLSAWARRKGSRDKRALAYMKNTNEKHHYKAASSRYRRLRYVIEINSCCLAQTTQREKDHAKKKTSKNISRREKQERERETRQDSLDNPSIVNARTSALLPQLQPGCGFSSLMRMPLRQVPSLQIVRGTYPSKVNAGQRRDYSVLEETSLIVANPYLLRLLVSDKKPFFPLG